MNAINNIIPINQKQRLKSDIDPILNKVPDRMRINIVDLVILNCPRSNRFIHTIKQSNKQVANCKKLKAQGGKVG